MIRPFSKVQQAIETPKNLAIAAIFIAVAACVISLAAFIRGGSVYNAA
jgi:hypothetical protein